ncbi:hypothetical protein MASR2M15_25720 [Anaerolineales bacterium]
MLLPLEDKADVLQWAYKQIFSLAELEPLLINPEISKIQLDGYQNVSVRYGNANALDSLAPLYSNQADMLVAMRRIMHLYAIAESDEPFYEFGMTYQQRKLRITLILPPLVYRPAVDIRLHPFEPIDWQMWLEQGYLDQRTLTLIQAIARSQAGIALVGAAGSGKTSLLSLILGDLSEVGLVQRAPEIAEKAGVRVALHVNPLEGIKSLKEAFLQLLEKEQIHTIAVDELRADELELLEALLRSESEARQICVFRGSSDARRNMSALTMLARRAYPAAPEAMVYQIYKRLPFIITMRRTQEGLLVSEIAEWQFHTDPQYADYVSLLEWDGEAMQLTQHRPQHPLDLDDDFWQA